MAKGFNVSVKYYPIDDDVIEYLRSEGYTLLGALQRDGSKDTFKAVKDNNNYIVVIALQSENCQTPIINTYLKYILMKNSINVYC